MTRTHTVAVIDSKTRQAKADELQRVRRRPSEAEAFYLPDGHYRIQTISGTVDVEAPVWILFDDRGHPYPVEPGVFERSYEFLDG